MDHQGSYDEEYAAKHGVKRNDPASLTWMKFAEQEKSDELKGAVAFMVNRKQDGSLALQLFRGEARSMVAMAELSITDTMRLISVLEHYVFEIKQEQEQE